MPRLVHSWARRIDRPGRAREAAQLPRSVLAHALGTAVALLAGLALTSLVHGLTLAYDVLEDLELRLGLGQRGADVLDVGIEWNTELPYLLDLQLFLGRPLVSSKNYTPAPDAFSSSLVLGTMPRETLDANVEYISTSLTSQEQLQVKEVRQFRIRHKRPRPALFAGSRRSSDTMHKHTRARGEIIVDDVFQHGDIDTSGGYIGDD
jgi:hypothetical protein